MLKCAEFVKVAQVAAYDMAAAPLILPSPVPPTPTPTPRKPTLGERIRGTYQKAKDKARRAQQAVEQNGKQVYDQQRQALEQADKQVQKWPETREKYQNTLDNVRDRYRRVEVAPKPQSVPAAPQK